MTLCQLHRGAQALDHSNHSIRDITNTVHSYGVRIVCLLEHSPTLLCSSPSPSHLQDNAGGLRHIFLELGSNEGLLNHEAAAGHNVECQGGVAVCLQNLDTQRKQVDLWGSMTSHISLAESQQAFTLMF